VDIPASTLSRSYPYGFLFLELCEATSNLDHLKEWITPDVLGRVWQELEYRLDVCRATKGAHIEIY
jgi:hypothetical protein